jgi:hypothetical protein
MNDHDDDDDDDDNDDDDDDGNKRTTENLVLLTLKPFFFCFWTLNFAVFSLETFIYKGRNSKHFT